MPLTDAIGLSRLLRRRANFVRISLVFPSVQLVIKNKVFFFGDYEGLRRRQGVPHQGTVPTDQERSSGFTNFQELITGQSGTQTDILGRTMPTGTILDPSTTRAANGGLFVTRSVPLCKHYQLQRWQPAI